MPRYFYSQLLLVVCLFFPHSASADEIFADDAVLEELWNEGEFTEGVAVGPDNQIYFSDIAKEVNKPGRILRFDPGSGKTTVFSKDSRKSNGLMFDQDGRLLAACGANGGAMALCQVSSEGQVQPLIERFFGRRFNAPNDLVVHPQGWIYFTDPRYVGLEPIEMNQMSVYRFDPDGSIHQITTGRTIEKPNGIHVSPDGKTLYVAETNNGSLGLPDGREPKVGRMTLNAFPILDNGMVGEKKVIVDFGDKLGTDGMAIDQDGRIYAAVRSDDRFGINVYSSDGTELARVETPSLPTNCCFGRGDDLKTLYVTAGGGLYRIQTKTDGFHTVTVATP
jgi:gluconolactonase